MKKGTPAGAVEYLKDGKIIAYPTETVFGIGCDPYQEQAVQRIF
ncbi:MAG: Sua5/YciO/YrdC/YwlC family protein, partial [Pseudomonadota bacterium]|nr:Sua5/YciO/YrdC/YwlC family protein [Pseudomonadota bacterium]